MLVEVIKVSGSRRSKIICDAMSEGINKYGDQSNLLWEEAYNGPHKEVAVFYGLYGRLRDAFSDYRRFNRKAVYIDLGYWERTKGGKLYGYHKVSVNNRHPTAYYETRQRPGDRFKQLGVDIKPWNKTGTHILVAGMGSKAADVEGFKPSQWEEAAVREIRRFTDRPIMYRPKPSWRHCTKIEDTIYSWDQPLEAALENCFAVVSHHSNVCVDAIMAGIPVFCWHGVAAKMGLQELRRIENPIYPDGRYEWACNIAYTQWRPDEMRTGEVWRFLRTEGIV